MHSPETRTPGRWPKRCARGAGITAMAAMLGACAALSPSVNDEQKQALKNELQGRFGTYQNCMVAAADPYVHIESAPPSDIAEAAQQAVTVHSRRIRGQWLITLRVWCRGLPATKLEVVACSTLRMRASKHGDRS